MNCHESDLKLPVPDARSLRRFLYGFAVIYLAGIFVLVTGQPFLVFAQNKTIVNSQLERHGFSSNHVRIIETVPDWEKSTSTGKCVLFVNCGWAFDPIEFRRPFSEFADWCHNETDARTASIMFVNYLTPKDPQLNTLIRKFWHDHQIHYAGRKTLGAGRILWFRDGELIHKDWCFESSFEKLKSQTLVLFD